jgi:uncharacterized protein (DUF362 family)
MKVAAVNVASYACAGVEKGLAEALGLLGGVERFVAPGDKVLVKPNMLEGLPPEKAVTTHPEVLRAVIREVKKIGAVPAVGDSPGTTGTLKEITNNEEQTLFEEGRQHYLTYRKKKE